MKLPARADLPIAGRCHAVGPRPAWPVPVGHARAVRAWAASPTRGLRDFEFAFQFIENRNSFVFYILN